MRIVLYEHLTGGGRYADARAALTHGGVVPPWATVDADVESFGQEGLAMAQALAEDFVRAGASVELLWDRRLPPSPAGCQVVPIATAEQRDAALAERTATVDWTLVVAPELGGTLLSVGDLIDQCGGRRLGPSREFVAVASDKHRTALALEAAGLPVPAGRLLEAGQRLPRDFQYPAVCKPCDGAGSYEVRFIPRAGGAEGPQPRAGVPRRLERYCAGLPASVAVLCGPGAFVPLAPCRQRLLSDGSFAYQGGEWPLAPALVERAQHLAVEAVSAIPGALGYVGVDVVLGADAQGRGDVIIEINPRVTTSYVGLRAAYDGNLAQAMCDVAAGRGVALTTRVGQVEFSAAGAVQRVE